MKKTIIIGSVIAACLLMTIPAISATKIITTEEKNNTPVPEKYGLINNKKGMVFSPFSKLCFLIGGFLAFLAILDIIIQNVLQPANP